MLRPSLVVTGLALGLLAAPPAESQQDQSLVSAFEAVRGRQRILVSGTVQLSGEEERAFWPAYDRFEKAQAALDLRSAKLMADFVAVSAAIHPATADALVNEHLDLQEEQLKLLRSHVRELRAAIPSPKLARYVQLLNKLDVAVRYDISQKLPLLQ